MLTLRLFVLFKIIHYSQTSDSGPSEIGTRYNKTLYKGRFSRSQIFGLPMVLIHFEPPERTTSLQRTKDLNLYCSFVRRFDCTVMLAAWMKIL